QTRKARCFRNGTAKTKSGVERIQRAEDLTHVVVVSVTPRVEAVIKGVARFPECSGVVAGPQAEMFSIGTRRPFEEEERRRLPDPVEAHQLPEDARSVRSRTKVHRDSAALCLRPADQVAHPLSVVRPLPVEYQMP